MKASNEMTATNVRLPRRQLKQLKRVAVEREVSLSRLLREILDEFLERQRSPLSSADYRRDPFFAIGRTPGRSGLGDLAERHNKYLYGTDE